MLDYRAFLREAVAEALGDLVRKLRVADPDHLYSARHRALVFGPDAADRQRCLSGGGGLDPRTAAAQLDFVTVGVRPWDGVPLPPAVQPVPAAYAGYGEDFVRLELLTSYARVGLPVVAAGFGYAAAGVTAGDDIRRDVWTRVLQRVAHAGAAGAIGERWLDVGGGDGLLGQAGAPTTTVPVILAEGGALAAPPEWLADRALLARSGLQARFRHQMAELVPAYEAARGDAGRVEVVTCDQVTDGDSCAEVIGCQGVCAP